MNRYLLFLAFFEYGSVAGYVAPSASPRGHAQDSNSNWGVNSIQQAIAFKFSTISRKIESNIGQCIGWFNASSLWYIAHGSIAWVGINGASGPENSARYAVCPYSGSVSAIDLPVS